jgi:hypothetical protein
VKRSKVPLWLRFATIASGMSVLIWLPFEDTSTFWVVLLSAWMSLVLSLQARFRLSRAKPISPWRVLILAVLGGLAVAPVSLLLIILKSGVHAHAGSDYSWEQIVALFLQAPFWMLASILVGLGFILWRSFHTDRESNE